jgi:hypothetical protein
MSRFFKQVFFGVWSGLAALVFGTQIATATTVEFEGAINQFVLSGGATSLQSQLSVGDTLKGSFTFDPTTPATSIGAPSPAEFQQYNGAISEFSLIFTSGSSSGVSLKINFPSQSSISLLSDPSASMISGETISVLSRYQFNGSGLTGLIPTWANFNFFDPTFALLDRAILNEVDWNSILSFDPNFFTPNLEFIDQSTGFAQVARFEFTRLEVIEAAAIPLPAGLPMFLSALVAFGLLRRRTA